jgi:hypothetical protein
MVSTSSPRTPLARHGQESADRNHCQPAIVLNTKLSRAGGGAARLEMRRYHYYQGTAVA